MKAIKFPQSNVVFAKDQPRYRQLPAYKSPEDDGRVVSCYRFNLKERLLILFTGKLWLQQLTFGHPLQPQLPSVNSPFAEQLTRN